MSHQIFTFLGEPALARKKVASIIQERAPKRDALTFMSIHAEDGIQALKGELLSVSMFAPSRVFLVHKIENADVSFLDFLLSYVQGIGKDSQNTLILTGQSLPKKGPVRKLKAAIQKVGTFEIFTAKSINPYDFLKDLCTQENISLSQRAVRLLLQKVGSDFLAMENEVAKLACYASEKTITDKDIEAIVINISEASIWEVVDAIVSKDISKAMITLEQMLEQGNSAHYILSLIMWQIRMLAKLQDALTQKRGLPASWKKTSQLKRKEAIQSLKTHPLRIHEIFKQLHHTNRMFNSSKAGDRFNLELLVLLLCQ